MSYVQPPAEGTMRWYSNNPPEPGWYPIWPVPTKPQQARDDTHYRRAETLDWWDGKGWGDYTMGCWLDQQGLERAISTVDSSVNLTAGFAREWSDQWWLFPVCERISFEEAMGLEEEPEGAVPRLRGYTPADISDLKEDGLDWVVAKLSGLDADVVPALVTATRIIRDSYPAIRTPHAQHTWPRVPRFTTDATVGWQILDRDLVSVYPNPTIRPLSADYPERYMGKAFEGGGGVSGITALIAGLRAWAIQKNGGSSIYMPAEFVK
jgi:hypothetical protein